MNLLPTGPFPAVVHFLTIVSILVTCHARASEGPATNDARPDIVVILADDLGYMDVGAYNPGSFYATPSLDALAARSVIFTHAYSANPTCSPSRYALMTGKYPSRVGATNWFSGTLGMRFRPAPLHDRMDLAEETIAERLGAQDYATAFIGKWHLGEDEDLWPEHQGFDINIGGHAAGRPDSYFSPYANPRLPDGPDGEHLPARLTDEAIAFLQRDSVEPRFLFLSFYSVHDPFQAPDALVDKYRQRARTVGEEQFGTETEYWPVFGWFGPRKVRTLQAHPIYAAMVESMDRQIGRLLSAIEASGRAENTVVVFTSDNGGLSTSEGHPTSNMPLRGGKGWVYEGGIRVPLLLKLPGDANAGRRVAAPVIGMDLYPTLLRIAGVELDAAIDGVSLLPLLAGNQTGQRALFWHYPHYSNQGGFPGGAVRLGRYKLVENYEDGSIALYDLQTDPGERDDISKAHLAKTAELREQLHRWYRQVDAHFLRPWWLGPEPWHPDQGQAN